MRLRNIAAGLHFGNVEFQWDWWCSVDQVTSGTNCFSPKCLSQINQTQHTLNLLRNSPIHSFSNTVVLWCARNILFVSNSMVGTICPKPPGSVLASIVGSEAFQLLVRLSFYHVMKVFEMIKNLIFCLQEIYLYFSWSIVNKCDNILVTTQWFFFNQTAYIKVYQSLHLWYSFDKWVE